MLASRLCTVGRLARFRAAGTRALCAASAAHEHSAATMKAVRMAKPGDLSVLSLTDSPLLEPAPGQVRVRVAACGVCYRDVLDRKGAFPFIKPGIVPGQCVCRRIGGDGGASLDELMTVACVRSEIAGIVEKIGSGVTSFRPGDRVTNLHWAPCGGCESCTEGRPTHCHRRYRLASAAARMCFAHGARVMPSDSRESFVGLTHDGGYAQFATFSERGLVRVPDGFTPAEAATVNCTFGTSAPRALSAQSALSAAAQPSRTATSLAWRSDARPSSARRAGPRHGRHGRRRLGRRSARQENRLHGVCRHVERGQAQVFGAPRRR